MQFLAGLRDVQGVHGSFVLSEAGDLLGRDLPAAFHDELLAETGPRIVRLCEALEHNGESIDNLALRFADHKIHVRRSKGALLCVIADATANAPALKMASSLVVRRLGAPEPAAHVGPAPTTPANRPAEARTSSIPPLPPSGRRQERFLSDYRFED